MSLTTWSSLHYQIMSFVIPSQLVIQKLSLPLVNTENIACFLVTMSFISCTLFCALVYPIWPLHSSNVLLHSSLVTYLVSTFRKGSSIFRLCNFVSYTFLLGYLLFVLLKFFIVTGKEKVSSFRNCQPGVFPKKCYLSVLQAECNLLACMLLLLFSSSLFWSSEE